ncbi:MAG: 6-bladed beta-propeller [Candidatus Riflebacteria bacterium]|nr:6-bladed beta-propeller [Candidatus Riflebacteria bacterium]
MPVLLRKMLPACFVGALLAALAFFCGCGGGSGGSSGFPGTGSTGAIAGRVELPAGVDLQFRRALAFSGAGVEVWIEQLPDKRSVCDAQGNYLIGDIPPATAYNVVARWHDQTLDRTYIQRGSSVEVVAGQTSPAAVTRLEPGENRLTATVRDLFGNPVTSARFSVWGISGTTDLQGRFTTPELPKSVKSVTITIEAGGFTPFRAEIPVFTGDLGPALDINLATAQDGRKTPLVLFNPVATNIAPGSQLDMTLSLVDPDQLLPTGYNVSWTATDGLLDVAASTRTAAWRAPAEPGLATITVSVSGAGFTSRSSIGITVGGSYQVNTRITSFSPLSAAAGQTVTIRGYGFGNTAEAARVLFGGAAGNISFWSSEEIRAVVPVPAESGPLLVEIGNKTLEAGNFTVIDYEATLTPLYGPPEAVVTIQGYGFGDEQEGSLVTLRGDSIPVLKWTNTKIEAQILRSSHSGTLALTIRGRLRPVADFVVTRIDSVDPQRTTRITEGSPAVVTISGTGFGEDQGENLVYLYDQKPADVMSWSDGEIVVEVPFESESGELILQISGATLLGPRLNIVYHDTYTLEFSWSGQRFESHPDLPGIALAGNGDLLFTDFNNCWIWRYTRAGDFVERIGTPGSGNGQFDLPWGIAVDADDNIFVTDFRNSGSRLQKLDAAGNFIASLSADGAGAGELSEPQGICVDTAGNVYVADSGNHRIQKFDNNLQYVGQFGSFGIGDGMFKSPAGVAVAPDGKIYVADRANHRIQEFDASFNFLRWYGRYRESENLAGWQLPLSGESSYAGSFVGALDEPYNLFVADDGSLYVADTGNGRIQKIDRNTGNAVVTGSQGSGDGQFTDPLALIVSDEDFFVADSGNSRIQVIGLDGVFKQKIVPDTDELNTFFTRLAVDRENELIYALDSEDCSIAVFDLFGNFRQRIGSRGSGSGQLLDPAGMAIDDEGNIAVVDTGNARVVVFSPEGQQLLVFGAYGTGPGQFRSPQRIAIDDAGKFWISDFENHRVVVFSPTGDYLLSLGSYGTGNGQFDGPNGLGFTADGSLYVGDSGNSRVQKFSPDGVFVGWFGADETGNAGWHGVGTTNRGVSDTGPSRFKIPTDLAVDREDCVYVLDGLAGEIQKFGPNHISESNAHHVTTLTSVNGFVGLSLDNVGNLYTTERNEQLIRRFNPSLAP